MKNTKNKIIAHEFASHGIWLNIFLLALITGLALYYVAIANSVTSKNYSLSTLQNELSSLQEDNSALSVKKLAFEDMPYLVDFARANNMVEAWNVAHIFEKKSVALVR